MTTGPAVDGSSVASASASAAGRLDPADARADAIEADLAKRLVAATAAAYGAAGRFARLFARGKLSRDPLFVTLLRSGAIPDASCLVDLGCGQGLLAVWLHAARAQWHRSCDAVPWPPHWPAPPKVGTYLGIDRSRDDIARARRAMPVHGRVFRGDIRTVGMTMLDRCDAVTLFDVLQYLDFAAQEKLLDAIAAGLPPWGVMVLRIGDGTSRTLRWSDVIDLVASACRGHPHGRLHRRPLAAWLALIEARGFVVEVIDDGAPPDRSAKRAPAANVLLRASRRAERPASGPPSRPAPA